LTLQPVDRALARALIGDRKHASELTAGLLHRDFPDADLAAKLPAFAQRLDDAANPALGGTAPPDTGGWGLWLFVYKPERLVVGAASFSGAPTADGAVELGYQVVPAHRRRGLTVEGCSALIDWAFTDSRPQYIVADCAAGNAASVRTLEKLGFQMLGARGDRLDWQLTRANWPGLV
jgi:RimJ/RimL family protein N-acetyltransferase